MLTDTHTRIIRKFDHANFRATLINKIRRQKRLALAIIVDALRGRKVSPHTKAKMLKLALQHAQKQHDSRAQSDMQKPVRNLVGWRA